MNLLQYNNDEDSLAASLMLTTETTGSRQYFLYCFRSPILMPVNPIKIENLRNLLEEARPRQQPWGQS